MLLPWLLDSVLNYCSFSPQCFVFALVSRLYIIFMLSLVLALQVAEQIAGLFL